MKYKLQLTTVPESDGEAAETVDMPELSPEAMAVLVMSLDLGTQGTMGHVNESEIDEVRAVIKELYDNFNPFEVNPDL